MGIWDQHFDSLDLHTWLCKHCKQKVSKSGGTSNRKRHMDNKHSKLVAEKPFSKQTQRKLRVTNRLRVIQKELINDKADDAVCQVHV